MQITLTLTLTQETDLVAVVSPASEFHVAALLVEGEPLDVDLAGRLVNGRRLPDDLSGVVEAGLGHQGHLVLSVGAEEKEFFYNFTNSRLENSFLLPKQKEPWGSGCGSVGREVASGISFPRFESSQPQNIIMTRALLTC